MRRTIWLAAAIAVAAAAVRAAEKTAPLLPCPPGMSEAACNPSPQNQKDARKAFARGLKLQKSDPAQAYQEFQRAAELAPRNVEYVSARELVRQQLVTDHIERGNAELESGKRIEALADFRSALNLDPANQFAQGRLRDALG
ncbi:MAG TPA: hypothetical protein VFB00_05945, partial [Terriglobales bacterium]|nr:hypothetical protein [Terriglobales bacterium]